MWRRIIALCHVALFSSFVYASDVHSPRTAALGGAGHAGPLLNDSIVLNPSFVSFLPTYSIALDYDKYSSTGDFHGRNYSVSIQDGRSEMFQAGVQYTQQENGSLVHIGASKALMNRLGVGLGSKIYLDPARHTAGNDATLSISGIPTEWFQSCLIVDNLLQSDETLRHGSYREFVLGTKFNLKGILLAYFDPHYTPDVPSGNFGHETGLEFVVASDVYFRLGMFKNARVPYLQALGRGFGIGIGWVAPRLSLDYGISRTIDPISTVEHNFGATMYF